MTGAAWLAAIVIGAAPAPPSFHAHVTNRWFPLVPGTVYTYRGVKDSLPSRDVLTVTHRTNTIAGAPCMVVRDLLYLAGRLRERTTDWYSQDGRGNVWYFGERTAELDPAGHVTSTEGSWRAGLKGATAGIYMPAHPRVGASGSQEHYRGHAEDRYRIVSLHASVHVPYRGSRSALLTEEWTPLEPNVLDRKYYIAGIGTVLEQTVRGGDERNALVSLRRS
ncbi:MAG TPA: hypothetical protein VLK36_02460 [Gaiellaceae bacterium]|nr:hypothetical protein [Gaiellaceae bacterium]